ncbi:MULTISPECIES: WXG100 family type VII secretion target [Amycolatopsis]|uniref:ESAT-6-like protein n=2 Tax=Amycolatopsis TaxID=1813 RepID=A0A1I3WX49_9PSEU|nr:WXG100 family type VII secretion target [Amycolatopsis sacchari]SFK12055.1 WXG100 family type VII secretion target [Amycolatopsis sacchari]
MADGLITYDYTVIENCIGVMKRKVQEIEQQTQDLQHQVQTLMGTWEGSTASTYNNTANDLRAELERSNQNLDLTKTALQNGSDGMKSTDSRGSKSLAL